MTNQDEQQKLKNWMEAYALLRLLEEPTENAAGDEAWGAAGDDAEQGSPPDFSEEPPPAAGQIRLWPAVELCRPPFYGLLMRGGYGRWRVFPFSELAVPAVPGELKVRSTPPVRVIQGWNARELPQARVAASWVVETLPEEMLFRVNLWHLSLEGGDALPEELAALVGPPLRHPLDPRHDYLDAEQCRADACLGEAAAAYSPAEEERKAAEPESRYGGKDEIDAPE